MKRSKDVHTVTPAKAKISNAIHSVFARAFAFIKRNAVLCIAYMVKNRKKLLPFNPANGWGSYDGFVPWLIKYKEACEDNPGCKIRASI